MVLRTAALIGLLMLAGCAEADRPAPAKPVVASVPVLTSSAAVRLPLERYAFSGPELDRLVRGRDVLAERCASRFGVDVRVPAQRSPAPGNVRRYGLTDAAAAASRGYHQPSRRQPAAPRLTAAEQLVLMGGRRGKAVPEGGCLGEAERTIAGGGVFGEDPMIAKLNVDGWKLARADDRVRAVFRLWSDCMRSKGSSYEDPMAANDDTRFRTPKPTALEIGTAVADVACKARANVVGTWSAVEAAYQRDILAAGGDRLLRIEHAKAAQLSAADQAIRSR